MITEFDSISTNLSRLALSLYAQEQLHIANNIANANTPGYTPTGIDFEKVMNELGRIDTNNNDYDLAMVKSLRQDVDENLYVKQHLNSKIDLDNELVKMSENSVKYKVLLGALKSKGELMKIVLQSK